MLVQLTISCCAPSPATLEIRMRDGFSCVAENGLIWSLEAANSISDTLAMLDQAPLPPGGISYHPHFTRELPASIARIMRPLPRAADPLRRRRARVPSQRAPRARRAPRCR